MQVIVQPYKICPYCHFSARQGHNFQCPECRGEFCSQCFEPIIEDNGHSIKCPYEKCQTVLKLPEA